MHIKLIEDLVTHVKNNARKIREYSNDLELSDTTRGTDYSEFIVRLRDRATRLH